MPLVAEVAIAFLNLLLGVDGPGLDRGAGLGAHEAAEEITIAPKRRKTMSKLIAIAAVLVALSGCAPTMTVGHPFDPNRVNELQPGVSTVQDAVRLFGPPDHDETNSAG